MRNKVKSLVDEAMLSKEADPTQALLKVALKHKDNLNVEIIKRAAEEYNVRSFTKKQKEGMDLEDTYPIIDPVKLASMVFEQSMPKKDEVEYHSITEKDTPIIKDDLPVKKASLEELFGIKKEEPLDTKLLLGRINNNIQTYLQKFASYLQYDNKLMSEFRGLRPDSLILKSAKLENGDKCLPYKNNLDHLEFEQIDDLINKKTELIKLSMLDEEHDKELLGLKKKNS